MKKAARITLAAGAAVVLVGGGLTWWLLTRTPSIDDAARTYLRALSDGDISTIEAMTAGTSDDTQLVDDAFTGASAYVSDPVVDEITSDGLVRAHATLSGDEVALAFTLEDADGTFLLAGDHLRALTVTTTPGDSVWIGDALAPAGAATPLLPAEYPVVAAPRDVLEGAMTVTVGAGDVTVDLPATIGSDGLALAQEQIDAYAAACTAPATAVPSHCGLRVPWAADLASLTTLTFRIDAAPVLSFSDDARSFAATGGAVTATASGTTRDGATGSFTYRTQDWAIRGTATYRGDGMSLHVD